MLTSDEVADIKAALAAAQVDIPGWSHSSFLKMADRATHATYATVAQVLNIAGLHLDGERKDATTQLSGGWAEKISVLKNGGRLVFRVHFLQAEGTLNTTSGLAAAALEQTKEYFQLRFADGTGFSFQAFVGLDFSAPINGRLLGQVTLDISGQVIKAGDS